MDKRLRVLIGTLILVTTIGSGMVIGVILPINSIALMNDINSRLGIFSVLNEEDFIVGESDWMNTGIQDIDSRFYDQAYFEFFNVSDRRGYLEYNTPISYYFVQGELVFDITVNKTILEKSIEDDYVVFAERKMYTFNKTASTLYGNETVLNFNYMWPYYLEYFGNGSEYGFQAYVASHLISEELEIIKNLKGWSDNEVAYATLNRAYAESEAIIDLGIYLPHYWISARPAFKNLDFDAATSYQILFNSTYNGHDYSLLTGEAGSQKYFLDIVQGLYYDSEYITIDPVQLLADIYGIDTESERQSALALAAFLNYLLNQPSLDWLYDNKISYVCSRTALEWVLGIEDPLLGETFSLVKNETISSSSIDWDNDLYYACKLGTNDIEDTNAILGIANIPYYEDEESVDVVVEGNYAYVQEGDSIKVVQVDSPLFIAVSQYGDRNRQEDFFGDIDYYVDGKIQSFDVSNGFVYVAEGDNGLEVLDARNKDFTDEIQQWSYYGFDDMYDVAACSFTETGGNNTVFIANGENGLIIVGTENGRLTDSLYREYGDGTIYAVDVKNDTMYGAYAALGVDGINTFEVDPFSNVVTLSNHYNISDYAELTNVLDVQVEGSTLYVLDETNGVLMFQLNTFGTYATTISSLLGQYDPGVPVNDFYVDRANNLLYLALGDKLEVVDISIKASPVLDATYEGAEHKGIAYGVVGVDENIYLADDTEGLVHLQKQGSTITYINKDQLHGFAEQWNLDRAVSFAGWELGDDAYQEGISFNKTYTSYSTYPFIEKGLRLQWHELFLRPFAYTSETDTAVFFDESVYFYKAESQIPYEQMEEYDLYWMTSANFINSSYLFAGRWNKELGLDLDQSDLILTLSFPGQSRDPFHMHTMFVEPVTGTIVERRDRVQYNSIATDYFEYYEYLDPDEFDLDSQFFDPQNDLEPIYWYPNWHRTFPGLPGNMGTLFWQEDVRRASEVYYEDIKEQFLDQIKSADAMRTGGAFGAMFLLTVGFAVTSVVLQRTKPKEELV